MDGQSSAATSGLVGRRRERDAAAAALAAALTGSGGLLLITGEAGIGKTRLVEEVVAGSGGRTLWGACWDDPGTPAFWPWTTVLRNCAALLDIDPGTDLAPILGTAGGVDGPGQQLRMRLFDGVAAFLRAAARVEPLVIVLEDLHFADKASLDLLGFVATALRGQPVAIVGTHRYPVLEPGAPLAESLSALARSARTVALYGLDTDDVSELIRVATGIAPNPATAARIQQRTDGNPLFVIEVARLLATTGRMDSERIPIPPSVQQVIARRLGYLGGDALDVLAHASVIGQVFTAAVLAQVTGLLPGRLADLLDEASDAGLVRPLAALGEFGFTHALVRDVLYAGVPSARRRSGHAAVATAIESLHPRAVDEHVDEIADHLVLALPDADAATALDYCRRAGRRAVRMLAYEQAVRHFTRAVALADTTGDEDSRVGLLLALGDARTRAGDMDGAADAYTETAAIARRRNRPDELARAALGFGAGLSGLRSGCTTSASSTCCARP